MDTALSPPTGRLLGGRYHVGTQIARGGMATVYVGTDTKLDRMVAIKIAHPEISDDADFVRRFIGEARSAARLSSPNVVAIYDQGTDRRLHYIAMEYVPGRTLRQLLNERGRLSARESLDIMTGVLSGLAAAHQAGLAHRDVKPENVLLTASGEVKVADFGLARSVVGAIATQGGMLIGTAAYLAPEQVRGGRSDARTDVYASGVMLFEMLTGSQPHTGESPLVVAYKHVNDIVPAPSSILPSIPPALDRLVAMATSRDPELRPADAGQLLRVISEAQASLAAPSATPYASHGPYPAAYPTTAMPGYPAPYQAQAPDQAHAFAPAQDFAEANSDPQMLPPGYQSYPYQAGQDHDYGGYPRPSAWDSSPGAVGASALPSLGPQSAAIVPAPSGDQQRPAVNHTLIVPGGLHDNYTDGRDDYPVLHGRPVGRRGYGGRRGAGRRPASFVAPLLYGRRPVYLCAGIAVILLIALTTWWLNTGQYTSVPPVKGVDLATAQAELHNLGLRWKLGKPLNNDSLPKGEVLSTSPTVNTKVSPGTVITLIVSLGPVVVECPNVSGQPLSQAQAALRSAHLTPGTVTQATSSTVAVGDVISTTPHAYARCLQDRPVGLTVSAGPGLPNFVGQQLSAAQQTAQQGGYTINPVPDAKSTQPANTITSQSPSPNTPITPGEVVTVHVSQGPPQVPVPDVQGLPLHEAIKELRAAGFQFQINQGLGNTVVSYQPTGTAPQGSVITLNVGLLSGM